MSEFDLIRDYFARVGPERADVALSVGDDCALLRVPPGMELAVSIDTLVAGVHFFPECEPESLGHKCLAVGLSDLAAMGAEPAWATLALTLPQADRHWLGRFARGFGRLATEYGVQLVGGDITRGPLTISVQVHGFVAEGNGIRRSGAQPGDLIYVSGTLGDAGLALRQLQAGEQVLHDLRRRLERPTPRVALGLALRGLASAMIDVSDGLAPDLGHILEASGTGAELRLAELPLSPEVALCTREAPDWALPLGSGDDYELCFTVPEALAGRLGEVAGGIGCPLRRIGRITEARGLRCLLGDGSIWWPGPLGYDHFAKGATSP